MKLVFTYYKFYFVTDVLKRVPAIFWREKKSTQRNRRCNSRSSSTVYTVIVAKLIKLHGWRATFLSLPVMKYSLHQNACNVHILYH